MAIESEQADRARLEAKLAEVEALLAEQPAADRRLVELAPQEEHALRDRLEEYAADTEKARRAVDEARAAATASAAAHEALMEIDVDSLSRRRLFSHRAQVAVSVVLPVAFMMAGIALFVHGRRIVSLAFTAFGCGLAVMAFLLAGAAIVVLFRPDDVIEALDQRLRDAEWVALQDRKRLGAVQEEADALSAELEAYLQEHALAPANGSARQALMLLDDAREARARQSALRQRQMALNLRLRSLGSNPPEGE